MKSELDGYSAQLAQIVTNIQIPPDRNTLNIYATSCKFGITFRG